VDELAARCRFRDCRHAGEPGCAVQEALGNGSLPHDRFESYLHLQREIAHLARKHDIAARHAEQEKWKTIARLRKALKKAR
jgi:ribosome biogenesis GTPase